MRNNETERKVKRVYLYRIDWNTYIYNNIHIYLLLYIRWCGVHLYIYISLLLSLTNKRLIEETKINKIQTVLNVKPNFDTRFHQK